MGVTVFPLAGLAWQVQGQAARDQALQLVLDLLGVVEVVQAVAAGQQFVEGLRAAQEHQAHQYQLRRHQLQRLVHPVFPAVGAAAHLQAGHVLPFEGAQGWPTWPWVRFITGSRLVFWLQAGPGH